MNENGEGQKQQRRIELKGRRPAGVIGEMKPEELLKALREARKEHTLEDDEQSWRELDRILREDPV